MRWLPPGSGSCCSVRLPLLDAAALRLEAALLAETSHDRRRHFVDLLAVDPALLLWTMASAADSSDVDRTSLTDLAAFLSDQALAVRQSCFDCAEDRYLTPKRKRGEKSQTSLSSLKLRVEKDSTEQTINDEAPELLNAGENHDQHNEHDHDTEPPLLVRFAQLAGQGSTVGYLARRIAEESGEAHPDEAQLAGLVSVADPLLRVVQDNGEVPTASCAAIVPVSLVHGPAAELAARAATLLAADASSDDSPELLEARKRREAIAASFATVDEQVRHRLPALVGKLSRLASLESEFTRALEIEKIESLRQLAYGAGHEINNPLANISVQAQTLLREETDPQRRRRLAAINAQVYRAHEMIADLMLFSRPPQLVRQQVDLVTLVDQLIEELAAEAQSRETRLLRTGAADPVLANVDPIQLAVALRAVCVNALEALGRGGNVEIETTAIRAPGGTNWAKVVVRDDGPGIKPELRRHLFDPFFSGREAGRGLGFGLSKCWRIVTEHGGRVDVESAPGRGVALTVELPAAS